MNGRGSRGGIGTSTAKGLRRDRTPATVLRRAADGRAGDTTEEATL